jgi:DNA-binding NtrC family response regulator
MIPHILIIDDLFGRCTSGGRNAERENLCAHFLWQDVTGDSAATASRQQILNATAEAVFCRSQAPACADIGDMVENDLQSALKVVQERWPSPLPIGHCQSETPWSMVLVDLCFWTGRVTEESNRRTPGMPEGRPGDDDPRSYFGLTLLDAIHRDFPELPIFILSSKPREDVSLEFSRRGALGFIARDDLHGPELLQEALWQHGLLTDPTGEIVGNSLPVLLALREARRGARHRENLLIRGERGTGKESLANYIHRAVIPAEDTKKRPLVKVNSAVFTPNLFASELFGIQPRTATGVDGKTGLIESANHGDLFLDEIADMPKDVQGAILRVLQERQITKVGGRTTIDVDVRFISATNADLEEEASGFRSDLFDRLRIGGTVWLPPLRDRLTDLPLLSERFVREAETQRKGSLKRQITPEALDMLRHHDWPGNVRELRSVVFDAVNRHPDVEHLVPEHLRISLSKKRDLGGQPGLPLEPKFEERRSIPGNRIEVADEGFEQLIEKMVNFEFDITQQEAWAGRFPHLQSVYARLVARYMKAALLANREPTPDGKPQYQRAMKLLTGTKLTGAQAADLIKRNLKLSPPDREEILKDDVLRQIYEQVVGTRPTNNRKKSNALQKPET